jgi:hypothetical protein
VPRADAAGLQGRQASMQHRHGQSSLKRTSHSCLQHSRYICLQCPCVGQPPGRHQPTYRAPPNHASHAALQASHHQHLMLPQLLVHCTKRHTTQQPSSRPAHLTSCHVHTLLVWPTGHCRQAHQRLVHWQPVCQPNNPRTRKCMGMAIAWGWGCTEHDRGSGSDTLVRRVHGMAGPEAAHCLLASFELLHTGGADKGGGCLNKH